jgi:hypothetical protein
VLIVTRMFLLSIAFMIVGPFLVPTISSAASRHLTARAPGGARLGSWNEEAWLQEDWSRAPAVRFWGYSKPNDFTTSASMAEYPWGYTTRFVRISGKCVASEFNESPGGLVVRYQRVMPSYYCR